MEKWEKLKEKMQNSLKNEQKLRKLTKVFFVKLRYMLFTQSTYYQYYMSRGIWSKG